MALFQLIDPKQFCNFIYMNRSLRIISENNPILTHTWEYSPIFLNRYGIEYANIYCNGQSLEEVCPEQYRKEWKEITNLYKAHLLSFKEAKIDLAKNCIYDLIPINFLKEYNELKNKITQYVFDNYEKPNNYDYLVDLVKVLADIKERNLNFNEVLRKEYRLDKKGATILYNPFKTITGRLSIERDSFPIMNFKRGLRDVLIPKNDVFLELDYNAAEPRTLIALLNLPQPDCDLHEWNRINVFNEEINREESKKAFFSWFYDISKENELLSKMYSREEILNKYYDGKKVKTIYGKEIECDLHHSINYIVQSTFAFLFLEQVCKVFKLLKNKQSFISILLHDSIVIDLKKEEKHLIQDIYNVFRETRLGVFMTSIKIGKNFKDLQKINI